MFPRVLWRMFTRQPLITPVPALVGNGALVQAILETAQSYLFWLVFMIGHTLPSPFGDNLLPRQAVSGCNPCSHYEQPDATIFYQGTCAEPPCSHGGGGGGGGGRGDVPPQEQRPGQAQADTEEVELSLGRSRRMR